MDAHGNMMNIALDFTDFNFVLYCGVMVGFALGMLGAFTLRRKRVPLNDTTNG